MQAPVLKYPSIDYTYWLIHYTGLPDLISSSVYLSSLFDISLIAIVILILAFPVQRIFAIIFTFLYFFYFICYNSYAMHHAHPMAGILLISFAFWPKKDATFKIVWEGVRYILLFIYADAFILKLLSGAVFNPSQGVANIKENIGWIMLGTDAFVFNKDFYAFFLRNPILIQIGYVTTVLCEGALIVGFFTKRFDKYLFYFPIFIHMINYIFIDVCFLEMLVVCTVFLNPEKVQERLSHSFLYRKKINSRLSVNI